MNNVFIRLKINKTRNEGVIKFSLLWGIKRILNNLKTIFMYEVVVNKTKAFHYTEGEVKNTLEDYSLVIDKSELPKFIKTTDEHKNKEAPLEISQEEDNN